MFSVVVTGLPSEFMNLYSGTAWTSSNDSTTVAVTSILVEDLITVVVQVSGKVREQLEVPADIGQDEIIERALASEKVHGWIEGKTVVKTIYVPGKLVSVVVK